MVYNPIKFPIGQRVRIADRITLEAFLRAWTSHHPLQPEQLSYAGKIAQVTHTGIYFGGQVIYQLEAAPGTWHERLLEAMPGDSN